MVLDNKTKKILKVFCLVFFIAILTGCTANLDKNGNLIDSRAITMSTPWSLSAGWFDFLFVIPIAKGILFINQYVGNVAIGVIGVTIVVNLITLPIMVKSTVSTQKYSYYNQKWKKYKINIEDVKTKLHKCDKMLKFKIYTKT